MDTNLSKFDLSFEFKSSFEMGQLVPFYYQDVVPGDRFRVNTKSFVRLQPMVAPPMHKLDMYMRYYYVPYRLLQENYTEMITDPESPVTVDTVYKYLSGFLLSVSSLPLAGTLFRQFGINSLDNTLSRDALENLSAYPFLAYYLIYNYYYMDPILDSNYIDNFKPRDFQTDTILDQLFRVQQVNWFDDYFISARPTTQYGKEVELDMDGNSVIKVSEMRLAEKLQWYKEKLLQTGNRYKDYIRTFFGVTVKDSTLQRPMYLGGASQTLSVSDVDQTTPSTDDPLANIGGKSATVVDGAGYSFEFDEHGIVLGLCFVKPRQAYISGIPRSFLARDFYDFFNPTWSNIGMQELLGRELDANRTDVFGYSDRYAHLKYAKDIIAGDFAEELAFWHFGRDIRSERLSSEFIRCRPNLDPFAVVSDDVLDLRVLNIYNSFDSSDSDAGFGASSISFLFAGDISSELRELSYKYGNWTYSVVPFTGFYASQKGVLGSSPNFSKMSLRLVEYYPSDHDVRYAFRYDRSSGKLQGSRLSLSQLKSAMSSRLINHSVSMPDDSDFSSVISYLVSLVQAKKATIYYVSNESDVLWSSMKDLVASDLSISDESLRFYTDFGKLFSDNFKSVNDHVLAVFYNQVDALRPIPKAYNGNIM